MSASLFPFLNHSHESSLSSDVIPAFVLHLQAKQLQPALPAGKARDVPMG